ncbi:MAG: hypothetical protein E6Q92_03745 [Burkholderiaceae bacterium]|nr:MAG: hypothetical protein E6Q92_03745 [Burkholderiaceae bacterium]
MLWLDACDTGLKFECHPVVEKMKSISRTLHPLLFLLASFWGSAHALCLNGRPTLENEFKSSRLVAVATVVGLANFSEPSDPEGIAVTRYDFVKKRLFKGRSERFSVWIDNTSSRIVFDQGQDYLVFVQGMRREAFVDACGRSALAKDSGEIIRRLEAKRKGVESVR